MGYGFCAGVVGNRLYYSDNFCNALCYIDLNTNESRFAMHFPQEEVGRKKLHSKCIRDKRNV